MIWAAGDVAVGINARPWSELLLQAPDAELIESNGLDVTDESLVESFVAAAIGRWPELSAGVMETLH